MSLKRAVWSILLLVLVLPSCTGAPSPQETSVPATTEVPTATPTQIPPTDTPVPTQVPPTETRVIIEYPTCSAETWMKCYIHPQELGIYGDYFNSLDKYSNPNLPTPDPNKVEIDRIVSHLFYAGINFKQINKEDIPFSTGFTYGFTNCAVSWGGSSHDMTCVVVPIELSVPGKPGETKKIIGLIEKGYNVSDSKMVEWLKNIQKSGKLMLGGFWFDKKTNSVQVEGPDMIDLLEQTLKDYPDIYDRIEKFRQTLDPTYISEPGILMLVF